MYMEFGFWNVVEIDMKFVYHSTTINAPQNSKLRQKYLALCSLNHKSSQKLWPHQLAIYIAMGLPTCYCHYSVNNYFHLQLKQKFSNLKLKFYHIASYSRYSFR